MHAHARRAVNRARHLALAALALCALCASPLLHATQCSISTSGLSFGTYDPLAGYPASTPTTANGSARLDCRLTGWDVLFGINVSVALSTGSSGSYMARSLRNGAEQLRYNLYTDPTYTEVFGDGSGSTGIAQECFPGIFIGCAGGAASSPATIPVYGRLPGSQDVGPGSYADSLVVTVSF